MQTTQYGARDDLYAPRWLSPLQGLARDSLPNSLVRSRMVEVPLILSHHPVQVPLTQDQEMVEAFSPHAAQEPLTDRVCPRRSIRRSQDLNPRA
jgi:hypothetical protein